MKARPWVSWPFPGVQGSSRRYWLTGLALMTSLKQVVYLSVHPWPPHMHPCWAIHQVGLHEAVAKWPSDLEVK